MEQSGEYRIESPAEAVWAALNDPDVLARCIAGCQSMEKVSQSEFRAKVKARVGPVSALFDAELTLSDVDPPHAYTVSGRVKGGPAGFGRGSARVELAPDAGATILRYHVQGSVGGKLAQIGSRLVDGSARKLAEDFFAAFAEIAVEPQPR